MEGFEPDLNDAIAELRRAIDFVDRVRNSLAEDRIAVGNDHMEWLETAARKVVNFVQSPQGEDSRTSFHHA